MSLTHELRQAPRRVIDGIEHYFLEPVDGRVYACVRISYAVMCFSIIFELWGLREHLFTEQGMSWHRPDLLFYILFRWVRTPAGVSALMLGGALCAVLVGIGLFTRAALLGLYLWNFAYCAVGYPAEAGYDGIARITGWVLLLAPPMRSWSLDARIFGPRPDQPRYALRLLQFQLAIIYVCTVWLKAPDQYWRNGELMAYFMMSMYSNFPVTAWAWLGRTSVLMTWGTLIAETTIPIWLYAGSIIDRKDPALARRFRWLGFAMGIGLHGGIAITSTIGMFSLSMVPLYASFLTSEDIDLVAKLFRRRAAEAPPSKAPVETAKA
jgi:hypothetical protein